ncbi:MAG: family 16 glycoside hydrolase [Planctomycetota bacterium]|jgi:type 1 glutamine amidotransferase
MRSVSLSVVFLFAATAVLPAQSSDPERLFALQGEYAGAVRVGENTEATLGLQLIAETDAEGPALRGVLLSGGLPGAGWARGDGRLTARAPVVDGSAAIAFEDGTRIVVGPSGEAVVSREGSEVGRLARAARQSPTLGDAPPPGAVVLFDGSSADAFANGRLLPEGTLGVGCDSKQAFGDHRLHVEFRTPFQPAARGQGRGNSGVYVQGRYECQVLDSFGLDGRNNECGGIYGVAAPLVNACLPPGAWQTYDIDFRAARFADGEKVADARMTVHLNGVLIHEDIAVPNPTAASVRKEDGTPGGLHLQDHGNPVEYRNVWVVPQDLERRRKVVLLAGRASHGYGAHEHRGGCDILADALNASGLPIDAVVVDLWPSDQEVIDTADCFVSFADGGGGHPLLRHLEELGGLMDRGVGLVCLHYAVEVPVGIPGQRFLDWTGGYFETHWSVNPTWTASLSMIADHPVTRGVRPFELYDEFYFHMRFRPRMEGVTALVSAIAPASTMERGDGPHSGNPAVRAAVAAGEPQHVAWARTRPGGGRGFGFTGAHVHWNWAHPDFRRLVLNAIAWCAHAEVPEGGVDSAPLGLAELQAPLGTPPERFDPARVQQMLDGLPKR